MRWRSLSVNETDEIKYVVAFILLKELSKQKEDAGEWGRPAARPQGGGDRGATVESLRGGRCCSLMRNVFSQRGIFL